VKYLIILIHGRETVDKGNRTMQISKTAVAIIVVICLLIGGVLVLFSLAGLLPPILSSGPYHPTGEFCLYPPEEGRFLTSFWDRVVARAGFNDNSTVLIRLYLSGIPGNMPRMTHFSVAQENDGKKGALQVILSPFSDRDSCRSYTITPSEDSLAGSRGDGLPPSQVFSELEQIRFSDLGLGTREFFIGTALAWEPPDCSLQPCYLLRNGTVVPLHEVEFDPGISLAYPWSIQILNCTDESTGSACSSGNGVWVLSEERLKGARYTVDDGNPA
jgi:hypothetical protein